MNQNGYHPRGMQGSAPSGQGWMPGENNGMPQQPAGYGYSSSGQQSQGYPPVQVNAGGYPMTPQQNAAGGSYIPQTPYSPGYSTPGYTNPGYAGQEYQNQGYNAQAYNQPASSYPGYTAPGMNPPGYAGNGYPGPGAPQQGYGAYAQMGRSAANQNGQQPDYGQYIPLNGGGYVPQRIPVRRKPFELTGLHLILIGAILAGVFAAAVIILQNSALKAVFLFLALGITAVLWIRPLTTENRRMTFTIIALALCILTGVSFLLKKPADTTRGANDPAKVSEGSVPAEQAGGNNPENASAQGSGFVSYTAKPEEQPTNEPVDNSMMERLVTFFKYWSENRQDDMLTLCSLNWKSKTENPRTSLFALLANRTPLNCTPETVSGTEADSNRRVTLTSKMDRNNGKPAELYRLTVMMVKENNEWYVDPQSLQTYEAAETPDPSITPTPGPTDTPAVYPNTVLYYNPKGGEYYHADPSCRTINERFTPLQGQFQYSEINNNPYRNLKPCNVCGAPLRDD